MNVGPTKRGVLLAALGLVALGSCGFEPTPKKKAPEPRFAFGIEIAAETTQITEPLLANGTPDYAAAINASTGMGVNLENNAVQELAPIVGMDLPKRARERLNVSGASSPEKRFVGGFSRDRFLEYFDLGHVGRPGAATVTMEESDAAFDAFQTETEVLDRGYCSETACPKIAEWLTANAPSLDAIGEAVGKPRFWVPLEEGENLRRSPAFALGGFQEVCRALGARASLRLGDDNWAGAAADILTTQKLAGLLGQSTLAEAQSTAASCIGEGNEALLRAATDPNLDVAAAKKLLDELEELPPIGNFELVLQHERFRALAGIFLLREIAGESGASAWKDVLDGAGSPEGLYRLEVSSIDWNEAVHLVNQSWDLARELVWSSTEVTAAQARQRLREGLLFTVDTKSTLGQMPLIEDVDRNPEARPKLTRAFVDAAGLLPSDFAGFVRRIQESLAVRDLGLVALALSAHRKESGRPPASLDTLAPSFLDQMPPATQFGHVLRVNRGDSGELALTLVPQTVNETGSRSYCVDSEGRSLVLDDGREPDVLEGRCSDPIP
jgi:hypothetical protein